MGVVSDEYRKNETAKMSIKDRRKTKTIMKLVHKTLSPAKVVFFVELTIEEIQASIIIKANNDAEIDDLTNVDRSVFLDYFVYNSRPRTVYKDRTILLDDIIHAINAQEYDDEEQRIKQFMEDITYGSFREAKYPYFFMLKNIELAAANRNSETPDVFELVRSLSYILNKDNHKIMTDYLNQINN